ncbi:MAG: squalene/phytoene synthase family protein [Ignavibacteria bacterium]
MIPIFNHNDLYDVACTSHGGNQAVQSLQDAIQFCRNLANSHYENFPVASFILPSIIREHVVIIYAFSRIADDISDEYVTNHGIDKSDHALSIMHHFVSICHKGEYSGSNPLWIAMGYMFNRTGIPLEPFERLLEAFMQDVHFKNMESMNEVYVYCVNSADPIGELMLRLHGIWDSKNKDVSDALCTALQMTNFLQDVSIDRMKGRLYIPLQGYVDDKDVENYLANGKITPNFSKAMNAFVRETEAKFTASKAIFLTLPGFRLRCELMIIYLSGYRMFNKVKKYLPIIHSKRPALEFFDYCILAFQFIIYVPTIIIKR